MQPAWHASSLVEASPGRTEIFTACAPNPACCSSAQGIDGKDIKMDRFKGKVLLIINVASACGGWGSARHAACACCGALLGWLFGKCGHGVHHSCLNAIISTPSMQASPPSTPR